MNIIKNIKLPVVGYDPRQKTYSVLYNDKAYTVRQTGMEKLDHLQCRISISGDETTITQEIDSYYRAGAVRRFKVKNNLLESAGVYELVDETGFIAYLYGANEHLFFKGKELLCNVQSTSGTIPYVVLRNVPAITGTPFSVTRQFVEDLFEGTMLAGEGIIDLILDDGMEDSFEVKCYEWLVSQTMKLGNSELETFLDCVRDRCLHVLEATTLLIECAPDEAPIFESRLTLLIEHTGYAREAMKHVNDRSVEEYINDFYSKLRKSGFIFHPTVQFCIATYLLRLEPDLMSAKIGDLFEIINSRGTSYWMREPFRTELVKQLENYIKFAEQEVKKTHNQSELKKNIFRALAIQLLLVDDEEEFIDVQLNRAMFYRYASWLKFANVRRMCNGAFYSLLDMLKSKFTCALGEIDKDLVSCQIDNWFNCQQVDSTIRATYSGKDLSLVISDGKICIRPNGMDDNLKSVMESDEPLWQGLDILLERQFTSNLPVKEKKGKDMMNWLGKAWTIIENSLFEEERTVVNPQTKLKVFPPVGEEVLAYIYGQDEENPDIFHCRIHDDDKGYIGEGVISIHSDESRSGMVAYKVNPETGYFMSPEGNPYLFEMKVVEQQENGIFVLDMKELIDNRIREEKPDYSMTCIIGAAYREGGYALAVTDAGLPVYFKYNPEEAELHSGEIVEVLRNDKNYFSANGFIQAVYNRKSDRQFSVADAFRNLVDDIYVDEFIPEEDDVYSEVMLERTHVIELLNIIERIASIETDSHIVYSYLGFAKMLARLIGADDKIRLYGSQMKIAQMLHRYAVTNDIDEQELIRLQEFNADLVNSNAFLKDRLLQLRILKCMNRENDSWLSGMIEYTDNDFLKRLASLVFSYNVLSGAGLDTDEIKSKIKKELNLKGRDAYIKMYEKAEGEDVEWKISIVYPAESKVPNLEKQTKVILKEICAFLNRNGGTLYLGVNDNGGGEGLAEDMKHPQFKDSRDKYDLYVRNNIVASLGLHASHCVKAHFEDDARGRDIYVLEIEPCYEPVKLDGYYYERQGSSSRRVPDSYVKEFLENRAVERNRWLQSNGVQDGDVLAPEDYGATRSSDAGTPVVVKSVDTIATGRIRNNVLHNYEDGYTIPEAYIQFSKNGKYRINTDDLYDEEDYMLTLAIHQEDAKGYLMLVYDDFTVVKIPLDELLKKERGKEFNRYADASVVFACPASDDDILFLDCRYKGIGYFRLQDVRDIDEGSITSPGEAPFDVQCDEIVGCEVIPGMHRGELSKSLTDRKRIGYNWAGADRRTISALGKLGIKC
ncbi:MAG: ATP-binding protein [Bacteroides sp.]|nr:ATP-binding protein [Bacteroides sp.]